MSSPSHSCLYPLSEVDPAHSAFRAIGDSLFDARAWFELMGRSALHCDPLMLDNRRSGEHFSGLVIHRKQERRLGLSFKSVEALSNFYSMYYNVVGSTQPDDLFSLGAYLGSLGSPVARLGPFPTETGASRRVAHALAANGFSVRTSEAFGNWIEPTQGRSFAEYFAARPSQTQNTYERKRRSLEKLHRWSFRLIQTPDADLDKNISDYLSVYDTSWKPKEQSPEFMPELMRLAASHGLLRLGILDVDGEPAAVQLWLLDGQASLIYKLAHSPKFEKFSVGLLLTVEMMRHAFDVDRVKLIDFGSGDDPYKAHWMSQRRAREVVTAYNKRTSLGQLASFRP